MVKRRDAQGTYYVLDGQVQRNHNAPLQPRQQWGLDLAGGNAHGVVFRGGIYEDHTSFDPWVASATIITGTTVAEGVFSGSTWSPLIPYTLKAVRLAPGAQVENLMGCHIYTPPSAYGVVRQRSLDRRMKTEDDGLPWDAECFQFARDPVLRAVVLNPDLAVNDVYVNDLTLNTRQSIPTDVNPVIFQTLARS